MKISQRLIPARRSALAGGRLRRKIICLVVFSLLALPALPASQRGEPASQRGEPRGRPALAADHPNIIAGIGIGNYYLYPKDIQIQDYYQGGLAWRAFAEFKAESGLSLGGEIGFFSEGNRSGIAPSGTALTIIPVTASLAYHLLQNSSLSPYFGGGIGIYRIGESDPDFDYLNATKFGKHIFAGADLYFSPRTILRAEVRQTFIDPVNSSLYYQANFGGLTALLSLVLEWPVPNPEAEATPEESALTQIEKKYLTEIQARLNRLSEMEAYYRQKEWDELLYQRWRSREILLNEINQIKQQIEEDKEKAAELRNQIDQKRKQYLEEKEKKRKEKKESVIPLTP